MRSLKASPLLCQSNQAGHGDAVTTVFVVPGDDSYLPKAVFLIERAGWPVRSADYEVQPSRPAPGQPAQQAFEQGGSGAPAPGRRVYRHRYQFRRCAEPGSPQTSDQVPAKFPPRLSLRAAGRAARRHQEQAPALIHIICKQIAVVSFAAEARAFDFQDPLQFAREGWSNLVLRPHKISYTLYFAPLEGDLPGGPKEVRQVGQTR